MSDASSSLADVGLIGLAVMGQNLVFNLADHGYSVAVHNRTSQTAIDTAARAEPNQDVRATTELSEFVGSLALPRRIIVMVKAGHPVDAVIADLLPLLDPGDIVIDGGNSHFEETQRRATSLEPYGISYVGAGVSGGEEGARYGPSIMPGGDAAAWPHVSEMLQAIAATAGDDEPCCSWIGPGGSGHFVKMIHNGIEYGDMQVLAEAYALLSAAGHPPADIATIFARWNEARLKSFLVEISAEILARTDPETGAAMVDVILDAAGQKGTGKWTVIEAMQLGQPMTLVAEAVTARMVSSFVDLRATASTLLAGPDGAQADAGAASVDDIEAAVYAAKLISYTQGFMVLTAASEAHGWNLDLAAIARLWRGGCIIRADFLDDVANAYDAEPGLTNLLFDERFAAGANDAQAGLRRTVVDACRAGVAVPALGSALSFLDGFRAARGPANLVQAQRDFFGAHTYERTDRPRGEWFHTDWASTGAPAVSGSYSA